MSDRQRSRSQRGQVEYVPVVLLLVIVLIVGWSITQTVSGQASERHEAVQNRAVETYGEDYVIVVSDDCYELCAATAIDMERHARSALIAADRADDWTTLSAAVPGSLSRDLADKLVGDGLLVRRESSVFVTKYRYSGPDGKYEDGLSDAELKALIRDQLYVLGSWMRPEEIAASVPAPEWRVLKALNALEREGAIKSGTENYSYFPGGGQTAYAHSSVDHDPAAPPPWSGLFAVALAVTGVIVVVTAARRVWGGSRAE